MPAQSNIEVNVEDKHYEKDEDKKSEKDEDNWVTHPLGWPEWVGDPMGDIWEKGSPQWVGDPMGDLGLCIPTWGSIKKGSPQLHTKRMQDTVHGPHNRIDGSLLSRQVSSTVISSWRHDSRENWRKRKLEEEETGGRKKWRKRKLVKELVKEDIDYDNKVKIIGVTHPLGSSQWLVHRNSTWPCWQP